MRMLKSLLFYLALVTVAHAALPVPPGPQLAAHAWLLVDTQSGQVLAEKNADVRIQPASLTKLMTAYLVFGALKEGRLTMGQKLPVSEKAWRTGGSRTFLRLGSQVSVEDLLKGMIVQSGNDAATVLAQGLAGSEDAFVGMMNQQAKRLGMTGTHFANATGLPNPDHYSTARDLSKLAMAVIHDYPEYYKLFDIKKFTYAHITQPNRNRLLWLDPYVDGLKTGHTESAGYCLIASAKRGHQRLLSVVLGTDSDRARTMESQKLLNYGLQFFDSVELYKADQPVTKLRVYKGTVDDLAVGFDHDFYVTVPRGADKDIHAKITVQRPMLAPVQEGQRVGTLILTVDGKRLGDYKLVALSNIDLAGPIRRSWDSLVLVVHQWASSI